MGVDFNFEDEEFNEEEMNNTVQILEANIQEMNNQSSVLSEEEKEKKRIKEFEKVKQAWKRKSTLTRVMEHLKGNSPDWKKISDLSQNELEYLVKVASGEADFQQRLDEKIFEKRLDKGISIKQINKEIDDLHWIKFVHDLKFGPSRLSVDYEKDVSRNR